MYSFLYMCVCPIICFIFRWLTWKGVESNFVRYDRFKYRSRAQLQMIPADEAIVTGSNLDAVTNTLHWFFIDC